MKTLKELIEGYEESAPQDIQNIIKQLKVNTYVDDSLKGDEESFSPKKVKEIPRKKERHGYSDAEDDKASKKLTGPVDAKEETEFSESDDKFINKIAAKIAKGVDLDKKNKKEDVMEDVDGAVDMYIDILASMLSESSDEEREELIEALDDDTLFNDVMDAIDEAILENINED